MIEMYVSVCPLSLFYGDHKCRLWRIVTWKSDWLSKSEIKQIYTTKRYGSKLSSFQTRDIKGSFGISCVYKHLRNWFSLSRLKSHRCVNNKLYRKPANYWLLARKNKIKQDRMIKHWNLNGNTLLNTYDNCSEFYSFLTGMNISAKHFPLPQSLFFFLSFCHSFCQTNSIYFCIYLSMFS